MIKKPTFLGLKRLRFIVKIDNEYWKLSYPTWDEIEPNRQDEIKYSVFCKMDKDLNSRRKIVTIFCPMANGKSTVNVKKMAGKKRPRIVYKEASSIN